MKNTLTYRHRIPNLFNALPADFSELLERFGSEYVDGTEWFAPATNLAETDDHYEISLDIAGMQSEDFDIEVKDGQLLVTGERKDEAERRDSKRLTPGAVLCFLFPFCVLFLSFHYSFN